MARNTDDDGLRDADLDGGDADVSGRSEAEIEGHKAEDAREDSEEQREADDTGDADSRDSAGYRKRIAKLTAQRNEARAKAQERDVLAARVRAFEQRELDRVEKERAEARATPEGQKAAERRQAIREALEEGMGPGTLEDIAELRAERQARREQYALQGISYLRSEMEDHGLVVDDESLLRWERSVGSELAEDPTLHGAFRRPASQQSAIQEAFKRVRDGLANPAIKQQGGRPLERIDRNRQAVLGSGSRNEGVALPEHDPKPPKGLTGRPLQEWWDGQRDKLWAQLTADDRG